MASTVSLSLVLIYTTLFNFGCVHGIEEYCSRNTISSNTNYMQFTKEASTEEFAIVGKLKGLHCCAKGYRSIEWQKDGKPYPWLEGESQLIIYPESANQTVYTHGVIEADTGNYTCLLRNDTVVHAHTIFLKVFEKLPDDPKITYISPNTRVEVGGSVRLFCEAFAGHVDLPDARNYAVWRKVGHNSSAHDEPRVRQEDVSREDGQTFGTYLIIEEVKHQDFGNYVCEITKPGKTIKRFVRVEEEEVRVEYINPNPVPVGKMILWISVAVFLFLAIVILNVQFGLSMRVRWKDKFGPVEQEDGKINDVLIVYSTKDSEIALGTLMPTLENRYLYKCASRELPANVNSWYSDMNKPAEKSRRIIAVVSPATFNDNWDASNIYQALKQLQAFSPKLCCISLKELPTIENETKNSQGETLSSLLKSLHVIVWNRSYDDKFWLNLRLRLPPKRRTETVENRNISQSENSTRLTKDSQESFENLV